HADRRVAPVPADDVREHERLVAVPLAAAEENLRGLFEERHDTVLWILRGSPGLVLLLRDDDEATLRSRWSQRSFRSSPGRKAVNRRMRSMSRISWALSSRVTTPR